jgi:predicted Zn-dependent peptidase
MIAIPNRLDERVFGWTHRSGLRVRVVSKPRCFRTHASLAVRFGSIDDVLRDDLGERALPAGLAHFLEHQMFESEDGDVAERFSRFGASANAATSFTHTSYVFDTSSNVPQCLDLLFDLVRHPFFSDASVAKERGVIAREIRMYDDDPGSRQFQNLVRALYRAHPVRTPIAGTEESIGGIDVELLTRAHRAFYGPQRMALAVVGRIEPELVRERLDLAFEGLDEAARDDAPVFPREDAVECAALEMRAELDVARPKWMLGIKDRRVLADPRLRIRDEVATWLLLDALYSSSSPAHEKWLGSGVIDDAFGFDYVSEPSFGFVAIAAELDEAPATGAAPRIEELVLLEGRRAIERGISNDDFERVRRKHVGRFLAGFDQLDSLASSFAEPAFLGLTPFDWLDVLESIERRDLEERARAIFLDPVSARSYVLPRRSAR